MVSLIPFHRSDSFVPPRYFQNIFVHKNVGGVEGYKYCGEGRLFSTAGKKKVRFVLFISCLLIGIAINTSFLPVSSRIQWEGQIARGRKSSELNPFLPLKKNSHDILF